MNVRKREGEPASAGKRGSETGTRAGGARSGLDKSGLSAGERGSTRASKPIGYSESSETFINIGRPSRTVGGPHRRK